MLLVPSSIFLWNMDMKAGDIDTINPKDGSYMLKKVQQRDKRSLTPDNMVEPPN